MTEPVTFVTDPQHPEPTVPGPVPEAAQSEAGADPATGAGGERQAQLSEAIEAIRPALQMDGGDINVVNFDESSGVVEVELVGACGSCPASVMTLQAGIERILKDRVDGVTEVKPVGVDPAFG